MLASLPALRKQLQKIQRKGQNYDSEDRIERYQKKILELLIRQKTTILQNQQLSAELKHSSLQLAQKDKICQRYGTQLKQKEFQNYKLKNEVEAIKAKCQSLQTENKMNQITRLNDENRCSELQESISQLEKQSQTKHNQIQTITAQNIKIKDQLQSVFKCKQSEAQQFSLENNRLISEISSLTEKFSTQKISLQTQILQRERQIQEKLVHISVSDQKTQRMEQKIMQYAASESSFKQKISQLETNIQEKQTKNAQITKQLQLCKIKVKQLEQAIFKAQVLKSQQQLQSQKIDKETKKLRKQLSTLQGKLKEIEQENHSLSQKYEQTSRLYKTAKRQLQKFKESLSDATQFQEGVKSKIDRLQLAIKQSRQTIQQKQDKVQSLEEKVKNLNSDLELTRNQMIQSKFSLEEMRKKYELVTQARNIVEQKLVLQRQENSKSLSTMIKQKDLCYRQNYKLLQILELKDKTLDKILNGLKSNEDLESSILLQLNSKENHTKNIIGQMLQKDIKGHKDRVKFIQQAFSKCRI